MIIKAKKVCRTFVRGLLSINPNESILDGLNRKVYRLRKRWDKRKIDITVFEQCLKNAGVNKGDTLIVHASWRACYMLNATPNEVIQCILNYLGSEGTLLMPCYGDSGEFLDVEKTPSQAGVLSECYRKYENVLRSQFPQGTMCGRGKNSYDILCEHGKSQYGFDEYSPYYKAIVEYNAKILLLGMGRKPHKITAFHCATYANKEKVNFYRNIYSKMVKAYVIDKNGIKHEINYIDRIYSNNRKKFQWLFKHTKHITIATQGFVLISFDGKDAYQTAMEFCLKGGKLYLTH